MQPAAHMETFGARIRRRRLEHQLSQRQLATRVGVDFTYLSKLENNQHGQSPGEELVRKLAGQLEDDSEQLLALAGKVPVEALRTRARDDADFAFFLRRLSDVPGEQIWRWAEEVAGAHQVDEATINGKRERLRRVLESEAGEEVGNLPELLVPLIEAGSMHDAHIVARLENPGSSARAELGSDAIVCRFSVNFEARQDECLLGVVTDRHHLSRLREEGVPLDDILVVTCDPVGGDLSPDEIARKYGISVGYCDEQEGAYSRVELERLADLSPIWKARTRHEEFPLVVLRARFPHRKQSMNRRVEICYTFPLPKETGYWFWTAAAPTHVSTITVHAEDLVTDHVCHFMKSLPSMIEDSDGSNGIYSVKVDGWVLSGHGVWLHWAPSRDLTSSQGRAMAAVH